MDLIEYDERRLDRTNLTGYDWTDRGKDWVGNYEIGLGWAGWIGLDRIGQERIGLNMKGKD